MEPGRLRIPVGKEGVEPSRPLGHQLLRLAWLPVTPLAQCSRSPVSGLNAMRHPRPRLRGSRLTSAVAVRRRSTAHLLVLPVTTAETEPPTGLEPATSTLARLRAARCATTACARDSENLVSGSGDAGRTGRRARPRADDGDRTRGLHLGRVTRCLLRHVRMFTARPDRSGLPGQGAGRGEQALPLRARTED